MKEKIKTQKGFIPIILIIVIAVVVVSTTAGIVKYKDEITANVSNVFKSKIETPNIESIGENKGIEKSELTEDSIIEEAKTEEKQDSTQQLQEQLRMAEQKRLEAERQLAEEKARQEAEKAEAETEELKQKTEEAKRKAEESLRKTQEDSSLKIARCQAKRDSDYSDFVSKVDKMIADSVQKLKNQENNIINQLKQNYIDCLNEANQYDSRMTPQANINAIERASDICLSYYNSSVQKQKDYTEQQISDIYLMRDTSISQVKSVADSEYYQCINR